MVNRTNWALAFCCAILLDVVDMLCFMPGVGLIMGILVGGTLGFFLAKAFGYPVGIARWFVLYSAIYCVVPMTVLPLALIITGIKFFIWLNRKDGCDPACNGSCCGMIILSLMESIFLWMVFLVLSVSLIIGGMHRSDLRGKLKDAEANLRSAQEQMSNQIPIAVLVDLSVHTNAYSMPK